MKTAGIIAEYNPFHNGHLLHAGETTRCGASHLVAVMSGNYVQRGEAAIASKFARAQAAVNSGIDLVLELPVVWSVANANGFARGAVSILQALGCVDMLSFGSESGDAQLLQSTAAALETPVFTAQLKQELERGLSFAAAREAAAAALGLDCAALQQPNDTLALCYLQAMRALGASMELCVCKRQGAAHDARETDGAIASGAALREKICAGAQVAAFLPEATRTILEQERTAGRFPVCGSRLETAILAALRTKSAEDIKKAPDLSEGLEYRLSRAIAKSATLEALYDEVKVKRYSHARIRRIVLSLFLGIEAEDAKGDPPYARVLAFNEKGRELLKTAKRTASIPIITRGAQIRSLDACAQRIFALECRATDLYALAQPIPGRCGAELQFSPVNVPMQTSASASTI